MTQTDKDPVARWLLIAAFVILVASLILRFTLWKPYKPLDASLITEDIEPAPHWASEMTITKIEPSDEPAVEFELVEKQRQRADHGEVIALRFRETNTMTEEKRKATQEVVDLCRVETQEKREADRLRRAQWEHHANTMSAAKERLPLRPATVADYKAWLHGFIDKGGKPDQAYDYKFNRSKDWFVAMDNLTPVTLYGALSINIIIPSGISAGKGDWGHCELFFMDGFTSREAYKIPVFADTNF